MSAPAKTKAAKRMQRLRAKGGAHVGPTAERYQHGRLKSGETMTAGQAVAIETHQRQFDAYAERGQLTDRQWAAGDKLFQSWYGSGIVKPCTGAYDGGGSGGKSRKFGMKPSSEAPRSEPYNDAWRGLDRLPVDERTVVRAVVLFDQSATTARWNARLTTHGISLLRYGLDRLADAFGLPREAF